MDHILKAPTLFVARKTKERVVRALSGQPVFQLWTGPSNWLLYMHFISPLLEPVRARTKPVRKRLVCRLTSYLNLIWIRFLVFLSMFPLTLVAVMSGEHSLLFITYSFSSKCQYRVSHDAHNNRIEHLWQVEAIALISNQILPTQLWELCV